MKVDSAIIRQLHERSYASVSKVLGPVELAALQQVIKRLVERRPRPFYKTHLDFEHGGTTQDGVSINGSCLYRIKFSLAQDRRFLALLGNPIILRMAALLARGPFHPMLGGSDGKRGQLQL